MKHHRQQARRSARHDSRTVAGTFADAIKAIADHVLDGAVNAAPAVAIGPVCGQTAHRGRGFWIATGGGDFRQGRITAPIATAPMRPERR